MRMQSIFISALAGGCVLLTAAVRSATEWNPRLAAEYLDSRQKEWSVWPTAASSDGPCVSCHTGMPYLLARPALRKVLHEETPTAYERALRERLSAHAGAKPAGALQSVETIFAAMFTTGAAQAQTFDQLWALQKTDGPLAGGWQWYNAKLDPWETAPQFQYGAALAALAIGSAPASLRDNPAAQDRIRALADFLKRDVASRPLHVRLAMVWASTRLGVVMDAASRQATIDGVLRAQQADGGWTLEALGPWDEHAAAPASLDLKRSDSYATAFTAYVLTLAGGTPARTQTARALDWLKAHQDRRTGAWPAVSMNKVYPPGSMEEKFLQDAATAFAVLALTY
jgi:squalene-hopene/tetraprenyl-beta-curcumene cyclase